MPSTLLMSNSVLNTSTETATNDIDMHVDDFSNFIGSAEKDDAVNHVNTAALCHANKNNATTHHSEENEFMQKITISIR